MKNKVVFVVFVILQTHFPVQSKCPFGLSANFEETHPTESLDFELIKPTFAIENVNIVCDPNYPYRSFDGTCNNLNNPLWGRLNSTYLREQPPRYGDGLRSPRTGINGANLPSARKVRTELFPIGSIKSRLWNINAVIFGQFVAHDMALRKEFPGSLNCCNPNNTNRHCLPIKVPQDDPTMGADGISCLNFVRSVTDRDYGFGTKKSPANQINTVTPYLDLSNVYGLTKELSDELRLFEGGKLKTESRNGFVFPPKEDMKKKFCPCAQKGDNICYKTGDSRANQNPELAILQTIFVREHNRISSTLSNINPHWDDERLFQESRRILIAMYQRIFYYEWLPIFHGRANLFAKKVIYENETTNGFITDYNINITAGIDNEFANGAFRFFHTQIEGNLELRNSTRQAINSFTLSKWFNRPSILENSSDNIIKITMGMVTQPFQESDRTFVKEISDELFACQNKFGLDLKAADIQRDRDHGLGYYNDYRKFCGFTEASSFDDYKDMIPGEYVEILKTLYSDYRDVDVSVGADLESFAPGTEISPTFLCLANEQFLRTRISDRFWYESPGSGFTLPQLQEIRKATVSKMFCDSGDGIVDMQRKGFNTITNTTVYVPCVNIPGVDLNAWKEIAI